MALQIIPILKFIAQSKGIAETASSLIKQFKNKSDKTFVSDNPDIRKILEVQASLNEQLEKQINLLQLSIENLKSYLNFLKILIIISLIFSLAALITVILL